MFYITNNLTKKITEIGNKAITHLTALSAIALV
jgi:hypothetical protein